MFDLVNDVPIPSTTRAGGAKRKYPFDVMQVGQMFFVPNRDKNNLATHAATQSKRLGKKFATRMVYMVESTNGWVPSDASVKDAVYGIGVWRTA